jgi:hypothetical protein
MAKLPRYMTIKFRGNKPFVNTAIVIKPWGIPFLVFNCLRRRFEMRWYYWLLYPYLCFIVWRGFAYDKTQ